MRHFGSIRGPVPGFLLVGMLAVPLGAVAGVWEYTDAQGTVHFSDSPRHAGFRERAPEPMLDARGRERRPGGFRRGVAAWDSFIVGAGRRHGISPALLKAVIHAESGFDVRAVSQKGAQGLMQLMPPTAASLGVDDPFNPWQNIDGGTRHLARLVRTHRGDLSLALAAYNAGSEAVRRHRGIPPYSETRNYVRKVLEFYRHYHGDFD